MKLLMKKTSNGSPNGHETKRYVEGTEHDLSATPRERELAHVFIREGWAVEVGKSQANVARLPLIEEYVAAGYKAENYEAFIKRETAEAHGKGFVVEVRKLTAAEVAEEKAAAELRAKAEAEGAAMREAEEKAAADAKREFDEKAALEAKAAEAQPATEAPAETPAEESKKSGKRK